MRSDPASTRRWLNDIRPQIELVQRFLGDLDYEAFSDSAAQANYLNLPRSGPLKLEQ